MVDGYRLHGTTTSSDKFSVLKNEGIEPFELRLTEKEIEGDIQGFLSHLDTVIINVPPKLRGKQTESFVEKIKHLITEIKKSEVSHIIFVSSSAVYGNTEGEVTEKSPIQPVTESGRQLAECEKLLNNEDGFTTTVIRFGGLIGPNRHPVTMLSGRENLTGGNNPINLIHLHDCIHMIQTILEQDYRGELFNGVYPHHPKKQVYYFEEAQKRNLPAPIYDQGPDSNGKIVLSQNFKEKGHALKTSIVS